MRLRFRLTRYFRKNWGAPFIIVFQAVLAACAVVIGLGNQPLAEEMAIYAFYSLVVGLALQLVCCVRYRESRSHEQS